MPVLRQSPVNIIRWTVRVIAAGVFTVTMTGGGQTGGAAVIARTQVAVPSGGASSGGSAAISRTRIATVAGGGQSGGAATTSLSHLYTAAASGGGQSGGTAPIVRGFASTGQGGASSGGTATIVRTRVVIPTGGASSGGSATIQFFSNGVFVARRSVFMTRSANRASHVTPRRRIGITTDYRRAALLAGVRRMNFSAMSLTQWTQDPQAVLYYEIGCDTSQDTITNCSWTISPSATKANESVFTSGNFTGGRVLIGPLLSGQVTYKLTATMTGSSGQTYRNSVDIVGQNQ